MKFNELKDLIFKTFEDVSVSPEAENYTIIIKSNKSVLKITTHLNDFGALLSFNLKMHFPFEVSLDGSRILEKMIYPSQFNSSKDLLQEIKSTIQQLIILGNKKFREVQFSKQQLTLF